MTRQAERAPDLTALLDRHREEITAVWAEMAHQLPDSHYREHPLEELCASAMRGLGAIIEALTTGSYAALETYLTDVSLTRLQMSFDITEVIQALLLCKDATLPIIWRSYPSDSAMAQESITQLDTCLRWIVGRFSELYAAETGRHLREQQERTALMLEIAQTASGTLELDEVLRCVARGIATAAGVRHCGFYLVDEEQGLLVPRVGVGEFHTLPSIPKGASLKWTQDIIAADAFSRQVLECKEPVACYNARTDPRTDKEAIRLLGVKSLLAVPFVIRERVLVVAFACTFEDYRTFTEEQIEMAWGIANVVALAIENAQRYQQAEQLAVTEERARIARDLHDGSNQLITGALYEIQAAQEGIRGGREKVALEKLETAKNLLRQIAARSRLIISGLRPQILDAHGLLPALKWYADTYQECYQISCAFKVSGRPIRLASEVETAIYRIVQESLNNVAAHARASNAQIQVDFRPAWLRVAVEDDGVGFDCKGVWTIAPDQMGLYGMKERAQSIGGQIEVQSAPGHGTRTTLVVPLPTVLT
jgi:signal transduction histidine kinase